MACHYLVLMVITVLRMHMVLCKPVVDEPVCTSRYEFESNLLRDMVKLNFDMEVLKQRYSEDVDKFKAQTDLAHEKLDTLTKQLENTQAAKATEMTVIGNELKQAVDNKIQEMDGAKRLLEENIIKSLENSEKKLEEVRVAAVKPPVAFLVRTVSDISAGAGKILKFTKTVYDTNNTYDQDTGYFTAPVNGTYMFSLQLCMQYSKYIHVQIFANSLMIGNAILYDADGAHPCSTINAVAVLSVGGRVYAKLGVAHSSGNIINQQDDNRWAAFMGSLVN